MTERKTVSSKDPQFYRHWTEVNLRYGDTDRQGHINNAVYCTLYESGRTAFLFDSEESIAGVERSFVIVKLTLDYIGEMRFPGIASVGSSVLEVGCTSFTVAQAIFKDNACTSTTESIIVLLGADGRSTELTDDVLTRLSPLMVT